MLKQMELGDNHPDAQTLMKMAENEGDDAKVKEYFIRNL